MSAVPVGGLRVRLVARDLWDGLQAELTGVSPPCAGRTEWISDDQQEREWAAHRCRPCPVIELCGQFAHGQNEQFGVWAGTDRTKHTRKELKA